MRFLLYTSYQSDVTIDGENQSIRMTYLPNWLGRLLFRKPVTRLYRRYAPWSRVWFNEDGRELDWMFGDFSWDFPVRADLSRIVREHKHSEGLRA